MERTKALWFVAAVHVYLIIIHYYSKWNRLKSRVKAEEGCSRVRMKQNVLCEDNFEGFAESEARKR